MYTNVCHKIYNIQKLHVVSRHCIDVLCMILARDSGYFTPLYYLIALYNKERVCLMYSTLVIL